MWLCNPCNPSGSWIAAADIVQASLARPDTLFVVDEAYIDFLLTGGPGLNPAGLPPNLVLLRSLTKIYHLCGVRAGYVVADRQIIKKLKRRQPTWSVNSVAQAAAAVFLRDDDYPRRTRMFYRAETPRFIESIKNAGFNVLPTRVNFFLVESGEDERLIRFLLKRGLVVRHTRNFPGLDGGYVRIATRLPEENELLAAALREFKA